ncbi:MAG: metallophosphoesterase [Aureispira sp.]|nr:metallophosphoesterase [Aureispira sp.]
MKINRRKFIKRGFWLSVLFILLDAFWLERFFIRYPEHHLSKDDKLIDPIKILEISDIHMRSFGYIWQRACRQINEQKPDLICFTGDVVDGKSDLNEFEKILAAIDILIPKVAILGNWEYWGRTDLQALQAMYQKYNCTLLVNQHKVFQLKNRNISITGVDDLLGGQANYKQAEPPQVNDFHLVLNHCPAYNETIFKQANTPVDFILSGHTHGGQVNFFGFVPFLPPGCGKYLNGWYRKDIIPAYVSKGVGSNLFPVRFGARAEMNIFYV